MHTGVQSDKMVYTLLTFLLLLLQVLVHVTLHCVLNLLGAFIKLLESNILAWVVIEN